jgi:hypothetical protein
MEEVLLEKAGSRRIRLVRVYMSPLPIITLGELFTSERQRRSLGRPTRRTSPRSLRASSRAARKANNFTTATAAAVTFSK